MKKDLLSELRGVMRPIATRVANMVARGVVQLVSDGKMMQLLQLGVLAGQTVEGSEGAEHFQPYGFSSVPLAGAEAVVIFPNGDGSHPIVIATSDRRYRPTGGQPGEVTIYNNAGAKMTMTKDGDIKAQAAPGRQVLVDDGSGGTGPLVTKAQFDGHTHPAGTLTAPGGGGAVTGISGGAAAVPGTSVLQSK